MDLASHLHKSLQQVQQETTSSEFVLWMVYLRELPNRFNAQYQYLAQIAYYIALSLPWKRKPKFKLKDFLMKFTWSRGAADAQDFETREAQMNASKAYFAAWLGIGDQVMPDLEKDK